MHAWTVRSLLGLLVISLMTAPALAQDDQTDENDFMPDDGEDVNFVPDDGEDVHVDQEIGTGDDDEPDEAVGAWFTGTTFLILVVLAVVIIALIVAMAGRRGGGDTHIHERPPR